MAVDLAGWIVQSNQCKAMNNKVHRPYLRNIFFRAAAMQSLNIYVRVSTAVSNFSWRHEFSPNGKSPKK